MTRLGIVCAVVFTAGLAFAQAPTKGAPPKAEPVKPPAPPADAVPAPAELPPKPAPELQELKAFAANWKCSGKGMAPDMSGEIDIKSTWKGKWVLGKHWIAVEYKEAKSKKNPGFTGQAFLGIDSVNKKAFFAGVDDMGGMMATMAPLGSGTKWVFEGNMQMQAMKMNARFTFEWKSDKEVAFTIEGKMGTEWKTMSSQTCKK
jgi:hypothetical protein